MRDIGLFKQGLKWFQSQKHVFLRTQAAMRCFREKIGCLIDRHGPMVSSWCVKLGKFLLLLLLQWKDCVVRGFASLIGLGYTAFFVIIWSCFVSLTSISCLLYALLILGAAGAAVRYLGYTPGLFIVGLFGILMLWMYGNFWITGMLFIIGGYLFSLNHARLVILMSTTYAVYCVKVRAGWLGVFLSINFAFLSNDLLNYWFQGYDVTSESAHVEEQMEPTPNEEEFSGNCEYSAPSGEVEKSSSCKSSSKTSVISDSVNIQKVSSVRKVVEVDSNSLEEMKRILNSLDHYEALGFPRNKNIDVTLLKKEYHKKAVLVHPDKNLGSPLASESFKKLQCAYEVLSDSIKKKNYDEQLRKEASSSVCQKPRGASQQDYRSEESRRIQCTKCGSSHIWICTNRSKAKARWCQDCSQYHPAKDGDGWVEQGCSLFFGMHQKGDIPRAFVCAESKIFDVSEWAICQFSVQEISCKPNTHRPTFHVNTISLEKTMQKSNPGRFSWNFYAEMEEEEEELEMWLQQALASGLFCETSKRRKSWSPFKLHQKKGKKQWRKSQ